MEQHIKNRYTDAILQEAMRRYGIAPEQIRPLDAFESFIYEFQRGSQAYILRIAHSIRRSEDLIRGEVDWINTLAEGGVPVARAIHSESGKLVESIPDALGGYFLTTAFVKAVGQPPWEVGWTPERYATYGQLLGRMHALAQHYQPTNEAWKRPAWDDDIMEFPERYLPDSESLAKQKYRAVCDQVRALPKESASYGLIHQDAHQSNFLMDEAGAITLFDFDDCAYSWFINDIAIVLFYMSVEEDDAPTFAQAFMPFFLQGYRQFHALNPKWLKKIPAFLKIREIELYAVIHRDFDLDHIDNAWCERFMRERKSKIERETPFIDFDFESLSAYL
jgi:Ser/Thr protein kinase RdoA (MazF antagonist)